MSKNKIRILCFGEAMIEVSGVDYAQNSARIGFAGDTLNTAIYLKRLLGNQADIDYLTVLGEDPFSYEMKKYLESEKIGVEKIRHVNSRMPGLYAINTDSKGERTFSYWRDMSAARLLFEFQEDYTNILGYDLIYFSGISLAILPSTIRTDLLNWIKKNRSQFEVAFDSNYRPNLWENSSSAAEFIEQAFDICNIALPSLDDQMLLMEMRNEKSVADWFRRKGVTQTILKRGFRGPRLLGKVNHEERFSTLEKIIDTTAAGDSFNAGFLSSYMLGSSMIDCAKYGHELAKVVIGHHGAICPRSAIKEL